MKRSSKQNVMFIVIAAAILILISGSIESISLYVDWLFFREVGYAPVFTKSLSARIISGLGFSIVAFFVFFLNVTIANRMDFPRKIILPLGGNLYSLGQVDISKIAKRVSQIIVIVASVAAFLIGTGFWEDALLFLNSQKAGISDPIFGKDISWYLFIYPFLDIINGGISQLLLLSTIITGLNYFFRGGVSFIEGLVSIDVRVKRHLGILISLILLNLAFKFYLDRFGLLTNDHGVLFGASYTDVNARILMLNLMTALSVAGSIAFYISLSARKKIIPVVIIGVLFGTYILGVNVYPGLLQSFKVSPNEIILEKPYIENHIKLTRFGYGLGKIESVPFDVNESLPFSAIKRNISTIRNIRLWDEAPLLKTYSQLQQIRTYYKFIDVDNDRYTINGKYTQVMLSPREMSYEDLPGRSWINEHLIYTHGIGLTMGPVSGITGEGLPQLTVKDIPPESTEGINITRPEIYYGENPNSYVVVNSNLKEFSYPAGEKNVYSRYDGQGGIEMKSIFRRLIYAFNFQNLKLFLSSDITSQSKIMYYRDIMKRVNAIAPFLLYDTDPYMVISDEGRLYWIIDAYSFSDRLPYSKPIQRGINYIRNPVKVVIDAYNGSVSFYLVDNEDIMTQTYSRIFPTLFKPISDMPQDLRRHIRYPRSLLRVQAEMFTTFHMTDPNIFYNKEDLWEIPSYKDRTMDPYYLIMKLPGGKSEEFILLLPFTPSKRDNLAAWMAARCDGENYGKIIVYTFPRDRLVFGPRQIDARIDQDAYISQQLTLWGQRGSDVIRGSP